MPLKLTAVNKQAFKACIPGDKCICWVCLLPLKYPKFIDCSRKGNVIHGERRSAHKLKDFLHGKLRFSKAIHKSLRCRRQLMICIRKNALNNASASRTCLFRLQHGKLFILRNSGAFLFLDSQTSQTALMQYCSSCLLYCCACTSTHGIISISSICSGMANGGAANLLWWVCASL